MNLSVSLSLSVSHSLSLSNMASILPYKYIFNYSLYHYYFQYSVTSLQSLTVTISLSLSISLPLAFQTLIQHPASPDQTRLKLIIYVFLTIFYVLCTRCQSRNTCRIHYCDVANLTPGWWPGSNPGPPSMGSVLRDSF